MDAHLYRAESAISSKTPWGLLQNLVLHERFLKKPIIGRHFSSVARMQVSESAFKKTSARLCLFISKVNRPTLLVNFTGDVLGLTHLGLQFHDLRHTPGTRVKKMIHLVDIANALGHKGSKTTAQINQRSIFKRLSFSYMLLTFAL